MRRAVHGYEQTTREAALAPYRAGDRICAMHDRDPFRAPRREPQPGTFHRPAHAFGTKSAPEAAELRLSGPMVGEQKLGAGARALPLGAARMKKRP